jgi:hypothetical protein
MTEIPVGPHGELLVGTVCALTHPLGALFHDQVVVDHVHLVDAGDGPVALYEVSFGRAADGRPFRFPCGRALLLPVAPPPPRAPLHLNKGQRRALGCLYFAGPAGLTDFELADRTSSIQTSIGVRRAELKSLGLVEQATSKRPYRWRITAAGIQAWTALTPKEQAAW